MRLGYRYPHVGFSAHSFLEISPAIISHATSHSARNPRIRLATLAMAAANSTMWRASERIEPERMPRSSPGIVSSGFVLTD